MRGPLTGAAWSRDSSGLPISTYFSAIKLRWMIDHHENVRKAHEEDDLMFGTVESWIVYVRRFNSFRPRHTR